MYWDHMTGWGWTMMVFWSFLWIALLGVVFWAVVQWARGTTPGALPAPPSKTAAEILDERLARGELGVEEYDRLREALQHRTPANA